MTTPATYAYYRIGYTSMSLSIDCHHPYYLYLSDNHGMQVINVMLTELNYNQ